VPDELLDDLKQRLAATRWPGEVAGSQWAYGTNLSYIRELVEYWRTRYDWRAHERELNRFEHFRADVDGLRIHFIHHPGVGPNPRPLMLIHGWPGSFYEFQRLIPLLTDPLRNGGGAAEAFSVVVPSIPGYGFSEDPGIAGINITRIAGIFHQLMTQVLGYRRYGVQGGDWGAFVASRMGLCLSGRGHRNPSELYCPATAGRASKPGRGWPAIHRGIGKALRKRSRLRGDPAHQASDPWPMPSMTPPRAWRLGSWRNSAPGATVRATRSGASPRTNCLPTS